MSVKTPNISDDLKEFGSYFIYLQQEYILPFILYGFRLKSQ